MKTVLAAWLMAALSTSAMLACEPKTEEVGGDESSVEMKNANIEKSIKAILNADDQLRAANLNVKVDVERSEAVLSGRVKSTALRTKAIDLAYAAQPSLTVNDRIEVGANEMASKEVTLDRAKQGREATKQASEKAGETVEDTWLHGKVLAKLISNAKTPARKISVEVAGGIVTLRGVVDSSEAKIEAQKLAQETEGVKKVDNQLKVEPRVG